MSARSDACYPWLTDFLCDYVDGTMEPQARELFEECLTANPDLAAHVDELKRAQSTLCRYGRNVAAPSDLHAALHDRLRSDCRCAQAYAACCAHTDDNPHARVAGLSALVAVLMVSALVALGPALEPAAPAAAASLADRPPAPSRHALPVYDGTARLLPAAATDTLVRRPSGR